MDDKKIIIGLIIVIAILVAGICFFNMNHTKIGTQITVTSDSTLSAEDSFSIRLTDINGNPLKEQKINITIISPDGTETTKIVTTDDSGEGILKLSRFEVGNYTIKIKYNGNENYSECDANQKIKIIEVVEESEPENTNSDAESNSNDEYYDGYWETSPDADFEYHTEYYSDGEFRQFDHDGNLVGSSYDEDQAELQEKFPRR